MVAIILIIIIIIIIAIMLLMWYHQAPLFPAFCICSCASSLNVAPRRLFLVSVFSPAPGRLPACPPAHLPAGLPACLPAFGKGQIGSALMGSLQIFNVF